MVCLQISGRLFVSQWCRSMGSGVPSVVTGPDCAISVDGLTTGYVEVKAPGLETGPRGRWPLPFLRSPALTGGHHPPAGADLVGLTTAEQACCRVS